MRGLLADINIQGQVQSLFLLLSGENWRGLWDHLKVPLFVFGDVGLALQAPDDVVWHLCQREGLVLITGNRNADGPTSLEITIRAHNTAQSLPVFTLADVERVKNSRDYAERVLERLLEYLLDLDNCRGTGRLYLP